MTNPELAALFPDAYFNFEHHDDRAIRLFGCNWGFGALGDFERFSVPHQLRFKPTHLYARRASESTHLDQCVFPLLVHAQPPNSQRYPVFGEMPVANGPDLVVQKIPLKGSRGRLYQLLHGRIEVPEDFQGAGRKRLLERMRAELGLAAPEGPEHRSIFLYPDGFCIHGAIGVPWRTAPVGGWFKVTTRGAAVAGAPARDAQGGLLLCLDPALPGNRDGMTSDWNQVAADLGKLISDARRGPQHWLELVQRSEPAAGQFFWPATYDWRAPCFKRSASGPFRIEAPFMAARVTPGRTPEQSIAAMEVSGDAIEIARAADGTLRVVSGTMSEVRDLTYRFSSGTEDLELRSGAGPELKLAVPLVETARMIRQESGMPARGVVEGDDPVGALWTFTPLENGLLHWPFPDATLEGLQTLVELQNGRGAAAGASAGAQPASRAPESVVSGAMLLGNDQALPGFDPSQRSWQLAITDGKDGSFELELVPVQGDAEQEWRLRSANVAVGGCTFAFEGVLPIIPFRQTQERLLPDHDERVLRTRGLRAVSPSLLRGIEKEMWDLAAGSTARSVQATVAIRDFCISAPNKEIEAKLEGRVGLRCTIASRAGPEVDPALRPWLWTRFDGLPTVQTMPLAISGSAALRPSGTRELQPLRRSSADATILYSFENALDMSCPAPRLVTDAKLGSGWRYCSPAAGSWVREVGMMILTLPSVSIFPATCEDGESPRPDSADGDRLPELGGSSWLWPLGTGVSLRGDRGAIPFKIELRHDLAWRDEYYATASLGGADPADGRSTGIFAPLPNNAPQSSDGSSSWRTAWAAADRLAALAASDGRAMVVMSEDPDTSDAVYALANFHGDDLNPASGVHIVWRPTIEGLDGADHSGPLKGTERLVEGGRVTIRLDSGSPLALAGLPDSGDLTGLSRELAGLTYRFGTLDKERTVASGDFADQRKLASERFAEDPPFVRRRVGGVDLYTLPEPLTVEHGGQKIGLWLVDVPNLPGLGLGAPGSWLNRDQNHLAGFRWALFDTGDTREEGGGLIRWRNGIDFEPLALAGFSPSEIVFTGRLGVWIRRPSVGGDESWPEFVPQIPKGDPAKLPRMTIKRENGAWSCTISVEGPAYLALELPGPDGEPPAILEVREGAHPKLHIDLFGEPAEIELDEVEEAEGSTTCKRSAAAPDGSAIRLSDAQVRLGAGLQQISLAWSFDVKLPIGRTLGAAVAGKVGHPRYPWPEDALSATATLSGDEGVAVWELDSAGVGHAFRQGMLALTWSAGSLRSPEDGQRSWLHLFETSRSAGGLMALIARKPGSADFDCIDARIDWETEITGVGARSDRSPPLRLRAAVAGGSASLVLDGSLHLAIDLAGLDHSAEVRLDAAPIKMLGHKIPLAAHVRHVLEKVDGGATLEFATVQHVTIDADAGPRGQIEFDVAIVAQCDQQPDAVLATIPGRYAIGGGAADPSSQPACFLLPPLSAAVREKGRVRLTSALSAFSGSTDGWAERLLSSFDETGREHERRTGDDRGTATPTAGSLDPLMRLADAPGGLLVHTVGTSKPWKVPPDGTAYDRYLAIFSEQLSGLVVAVPPAFLNRRAPRGYVLHGPDIHRERMVRLAGETSVAAPTGSPELPNGSGEVWEKRLIASSAPWAAAALLTTFAAQEGMMQVRIVRSPGTAGGEVRPPGLAWKAERIALVDPHRIAFPAGPEQLALAYLPVASGAVDLSCRVAGWNEDAVDPILSAHGLQRVWQLERFPSREQDHYRDRGDFWLSLRQNVAFRPSSQWQKGKRLTAQIWGPAAEVAAAGLLPSTAAWEPEETDDEEFRQYFAPAQLILRDVSPRPGVWHMRRLGLSAGDGNGSALAAPELPFHARTPRPPITGRHDRLRASDFEGEPFILSAHPEFVLYGPRAAPPHQPGPAPALSRAPLAESAWRGIVSRPAGGLIEPGWDGMIGFDLEPLSTLAGEGVWKLGAARALLDGRVFRLASVDPVPGTDNPQFLISGKLNESSGDNFADHVSGLRLSTRALIECELKLDGAPQLSRLVTFELLVAPTGATGVELPFYLRFEDPAYNDRLTLPAKFAPEPADVLFCADRDDVRPTDLLVVAWRSNGGAAPPPSRFALTVVRAPTPGAPPDPPVALDSWPATGGDDVWAMIDCRRLKKGDEEFELRPGDRLLVAVTDPSDGRTGASLEFEVTLEPLFPGNPAAFALLGLDTAAAPGAISAPLYAQSPTPAGIELLDFRDLFNGVARFRATYRWIHFAARTSHRPTLFAMQKIAGDGSTWIPSLLSAWKAASNSSASKRQD